MIEVLFIGFCMSIPIIIIGTIIWIDHRAHKVIAEHMGESIGKELD